LILRCFCSVLIAFVAFRSHLFWCETGAVACWWTRLRGHAAPQIALRGFNLKLTLASTPPYPAREVSLRNLDASARLAPSGIRKGGPERKLYEDILFARTGPQDEGAISRRSGLLLILKIAKQIRPAPTPGDVRWLPYAGKDRNGQLFAPGTKELEARALAHLPRDAF
jgi:hypothetical protein